MKINEVIIKDTLAEDIQREIDSSNLTEQQLNEYLGALAAMAGAGLTAWEYKKLVDKHGSYNPQNWPAAAQRELAANVAIGAVGGGAAVGGLRAGSKIVKGVGNKIANLFRSNKKLVTPSKSVTGGVAKGGTIGAVGAGSLTGTELSPSKALGGPSTNDRESKIGNIIPDAKKAFKDTVPYTPQSLGAQGRF